MSSLDNPKHNVLVGQGRGWGTEQEESKEHETRLPSEPDAWKPRLSPACPLHALGRHGLLLYKMVCMEGGEHFPRNTTVDGYQRQQHWRMGVMDLARTQPQCKEQQHSSALLTNAE